MGFRLLGLGGQHGGAVVSAVASQQEGPGFESRPFCVELACSPRVCVGFLRVLRFPPTSKDMHSILLSLPRDQGTGIRTGVGPRALHCGCPLFLTSLGWVKCRGQISPPGLIKYDLFIVIFIYNTRWVVLSKSTNFGISNRFWSLLILSNDGGSIQVHSVERKGT